MSGLSAKWVGAWKHERQRGAWGAGPDITRIVSEMRESWVQAWVRACVPSVPEFVHAEPSKVQSKSTVKEVCVRETGIREQGLRRAHIVVGIR